MIQIDLPMPKACDVCPLNYDFGVCRGMNEDEWERNKKDWERQICDGEQRPEYCPLKEQKPVKPVLACRGNAWECGVCGQIVAIYGDDRKHNFCHRCGAQVGWAEG